MTFFSSLHSILATILVVFVFFSAHAEAGYGNAAGTGYGKSYSGLGG